MDYGLLVLEIDRGKCAVYFYCKYPVYCLTMDKPRSIYCILAPQYIHCFFFVISGDYPLGHEADVMSVWVKFV